MANKIPKIAEVLRAYNLLVRNIDEDAHANKGGRAYGGVIRSGKGALVESIAKTIVEIAWHNIGGAASRLSFERKQIIVPVQRAYIAKISDKEIRAYINKHIRNYSYKFKTDVHVNIDNALAVGIECKAYTENAMIKRIAVDFMFLRQAHPNANTVLFQLESQLGGDYSAIKKQKHYGSYSTHTILSYFDIDLNIITLLEGDRKVDEPIHKEKFYKKLAPSSLIRAIKVFENLLKKFV